MGKLKLRIFFVALAAMLVALLSQPVSVDYQTYWKSASVVTTNVVTTGGIRLAIQEKYEKGKEFPAEGVYIIPGDVVSRQVSIKSNCDNPFYLRVKVVCGVNAQELSADDCFKLNINEADWEFHEGWYYYKGIVEPGQTTSDLFSQVEIVGAQVNSSYIGKILTLTVNAQAVQSQNNPITDGKAYTAAGWPRE